MLLGDRKVYKIETIPPQGNPRRGPPRRNGPYSSVLVVGSQAQGEYSEVSKALMSSAESSKSYTLAFSSILAGVTDFGRGTNP